MRRRQMEKPKSFDEVRERVWRLCYDSKQGRSPGQEDHEFLEAMMRFFPKEYRETHRDAVASAVEDFRSMWGG